MLSDRIAVMYEGASPACSTRRKRRSPRIGLLMSGAEADA